MTTDAATAARADQVEHAYELANVFLFCRQLQRECDDANRREIDLLLRQAIHKCQVFIGKGIRCGTAPNGAATEFLRRRNWGHLDEVTGLWARYLAAGLIEPSASVDFNAAAINEFSPMGLVHPLEMAGVNENADAMRFLLEAGADTAMVPTRDWSGYSFRTGAAEGGTDGPIDDLHSFIWSKTPNSAVAPLLASLVLEATMRRQIAEVAATMAAPDAVKQAGQVVRRACRMV